MRMRRVRFHAANGSKSKRDRRDGKSTGWRSVRSDIIISRVWRQARHRYLIYNSSKLLVRLRTAQGQARLQWPMFAVVAHRLPMSDIRPVSNLCKCFFACFLDILSLQLATSSTMATGNLNRRAVPTLPKYGPS